jgi:hypothetical protein
VLPCRPRRDRCERRCPHGRDISCARCHPDDDLRLGRPLCPDCYDYQTAVLFNAHAADLWRRFVTYLSRHLAALAGITHKQFRAVAAARCDDPDGSAVLLRFGDQLDPRPIWRADGLPGTGARLDVAAVGNYLAKYATKALDAPGVPDRPLRTRADIEALSCSRHYRQMITTAWDLGRGRHFPARSRLCKWAHMLGYGGHFLTKSRRYSVTFGQLRRARLEHRKRQRHPTGERDPGDGPSTRPSSWSCAPGPMRAPATPSPRCRSGTCLGRTRPRAPRPGRR